MNNEVIYVYYGRAVISIYNLLKGTLYSKKWLLKSQLFNLYYSQELYGKKNPVRNSALKQRMKTTRFIVSANKILPNLARQTGNKNKYI